jgi:hypothetical protein
MKFDPGATMFRSLKHDRHFRRPTLPVSPKTPTGVHQRASAMRRWFPRQIRRPHHDEQPAQALGARTRAMVRRDSVRAHRQRGTDDVFTVFQSRGSTSTSTSVRPA